MASRTKPRARRQWRGSLESIGLWGDRTEHPSSFGDLFENFHGHIHGNILRCPFCLRFRPGF
jgi:hypothetical protein